MPEHSLKHPITHAAQSAADIRNWLTQFATAVRAVDYSTGVQLFAAEVVSFGTRVAVIYGIDELVNQQWHQVWGRTRGFNFNLSTAHIETESDNAWAAVEWRSQGWIGSMNSGHWFDRTGRATFIFRKRDDRWLAIHSHFSLSPHGPALVEPSAEARQQP